jgi:hypothetical protein
MTLNHRMMLERYPNLKEEVGGLVPGCEISSSLDRKNLLGGQLPHVLWLQSIGLLSQIVSSKEKKVTLTHAPITPNFPV